MEVGVRTAAPLRGQHTDEILASLGYRPDAIAALRAQKVVA
jgi:crotonobetainyl-CoA:carnitine CoA-transferase CaiB-like acyl-CoA transferase